MHVVDEELPVREPYAPATHVVHAKVPVVRSLYQPTAHAVQASDVELTATVPYMPAVQAVHAEVPLVSAL